MSHGTPILNSDHGTQANGTLSRLVRNARLLLQGPEETRILGFNWIWEKCNGNLNSRGSRDPAKEDSSAGEFPKDALLL